MTTAPPAVAYDPAADVLVVRFTERSSGWTVDLDADRTVRYAEDGTPAAVELRRVRLGVDLEGLPRVPVVADALRRTRLGGWVVAPGARVTAARGRPRADAHERRLATRAARALRAGGIGSVEELYGTYRYDLLRIPGLGARGFDYINEALNTGDAARLQALFGAAEPAVMPDNERSS
jgi:hypothetical protein